MAILKITPREGLAESLRIALEDIVKCDVCDVEEYAPEVRRDAHARIAEIQEDAIAHGLTLHDLYEYLMMWEGLRTECETE